VDENKASQTTEQYKWINELSNDPLMQNKALLGMRKPNFDDNSGAAPVKVLYSKSKQVNQGGTVRDAAAARAE
jgi:hypothetical protein